jgi:hypothetical protein
MMADDKIGSYFKRKGLGQGDLMSHIIFNIFVADLVVLLDRPKEKGPNVIFNMSKI